MFKKIGYIFMVLMLLIVFVVPQAHSAAKQIDLYRYLYPAGALFDVVEVSWEDPVASDYDKILNNVQVTTQSLVAGATQLLAINFTAQSDCARTLSVTLSSAVVTTTYIVGSALTIYGTDSTGVQRVEVIVASQTVAYSNYAYLLVSSVTYSLTSIVRADDNTSDFVAIDVGVGVKLGLPVNIGASTQVFGVIEDALVTDPASKANATYNTIDFASDPNATRDYQIFIRPPIYKVPIEIEPEQ